jgi:hypothetical protein
MVMRNSKNLLKSEEGQILVYVLIVTLVASLVISPLIGLTYSGYRSASISNDKMAQFYAADTGFEDAIYQIVNRGNDTPPEEHNPKVPVDFGSAGSITYWMGDDPTTPEEEKIAINGCYVKLNVERVGPGNDTYVVKSTSTDIENETETKSIIQAMIIIGTGNQTVSGEGPGPGGVSPFSYAVASLGPGTLTLQGSSGNPTAVNGDIYSSGDMVIQSYVSVSFNGGRPSNVWANGTLTMQASSSVSGDAHSNGDMTLGAGAQIGFNAYSGGSITLASPSSSAARIGNSSYAMGDITLYNSSTIGNTTQAGGNINVNGKNLPAAGILGSAFAHQNIVGDGQKDASAIIGGDATAGGSISPTTTKWIIYGNKYPNTVPAPPAPSLPPMIEIRNPSIDYWQSFYKQEAHGLNPTPDPDEYPLLEDVHGLPGYEIYEMGTIYLHSNAELTLGPMHVTFTPDYPTVHAIDLQNNVVLHLADTVYVDGSVYLDNNCQIVGGGKLVATGDITIYNSAIGMGNATTLPLIMSINGNILTKNCGNMSAVLYAPNGTVDIGANDVVFGSVVAKSITNKNNIVLTYDERVTSIPGLPGGWEAGNGTVPTHWEETLPAGVYIQWYNVVK